MLKLNWMAALALVAMCVGRTARAAGIELPPEAIGPDTFFVIHADAAHLTPDQIRAAAATAMGDNADQANDFIASFRERYDKAVKAGVESVVVIGTSSQRVGDAGNNLNADGKQNQRGMNPPVVWFRLKAGGDMKALEQALMKDVPEKQRGEILFDQVENWVVMHRKGQEAPEKLDPVRSRAFSDALGTMSESAIRLAMIPDAKIKEEMNKFAGRDAAPKLAKDALPPLSASRWITIAVALGNNPGLTISANTADGASARQLRDAVDRALEDLKHPPENGGPLVILGPMLAPLADGMKPMMNGSIVTSSLKGEPLNHLVTMITTFRMAARPPAPPAK